MLSACSCSPAWRGVDPAEAAQGLHHLADQVGDGGRFGGAFIQQRQGLLGQRGQVLGIGQPVALLAQVFFLARLAGCAASISCAW